MPMRLAVVLALLLGATMFPVSGNADAARPDGAMALIDLLAPELAAPEDSLSTPVVSWGEPLRISVVGRDADARRRAVETILLPLADRFTAVTKLPAVAGDGLDQPNILFLLVENRTEFQSFKPLMDELFEGDTRYSDAVLEQFIASNRFCRYFSIDLHKVYWRAIAYIAYDGNDAKSDSCVASMLGGVIGLQGRLAAGTSVREKGSAVTTFSDIDVAALGILYDRKINPGTPLRDIMPVIEEAGARLSP